jgi:hypothetical protein
MMFVPSMTTELSAEASEWVDPQEWGERDMWLAIAAQRRVYEENAAELWERVKQAVRSAVTAVNGNLNETLRLESGDARDGGLALTRFCHPLALVDLTIDVESGMIGGLYTFASRPGDPYREHFNVWLIRSNEGSTFLTDASGVQIESLDAMARQVIAPCFANIVRRSVETGVLGAIDPARQP